MVAIPPPTRPVEWTFQCDAGRGWEKSSQRLDHPTEAVIAACDWLKVCAENGFFPAVRISKVEIV